MGTSSVVEEIGDFLVAAANKPLNASDFGLLLLVGSLLTVNY